MNPTDLTIKALDELQETDSKATALTAEQLDHVESYADHRRDEHNNAPIALDQDTFRSMLAMARRTLAAEAECEALRAELEAERSDPRPRRDWTEAEIREASR